MKTEGSANMADTRACSGPPPPSHPSSTVKQVCVNEAGAVACMHAEAARSKKKLQSSPCAKGAAVITALTTAISRSRYREHA